LAADGFHYDALRTVIEPSLNLGQWAVFHFLTASVKPLPSSASQSARYVLSTAIISAASASHAPRSFGTLTFGAGKTHLAMMAAISALLGVVGRPLISSRIRLAASDAGLLGTAAVTTDVEALADGTLLGWGQAPAVSQEAQ
jgi:hypothetical protein